MEQKYKSVWKGNNKQNYTYPQKKATRGNWDDYVNGTWEWNPLTGVTTHYSPKESERRKLERVKQGKQKYPLPS